MAVPVAVGGTPYRVRYTATVIILDGRQVIRVKHGPYSIGDFATAEDLAAAGIDPAVLAVDDEHR